ncbi:MAG TPA: hypothetical protein DCZ41_01850, partial [Firmicutes bacterium]|nr:hypothetical protein [Bacillota bacterium]
MFDLSGFCEGFLIFEKISKVFATSSFKNERSSKDRAFGAFLWKQFKKTPLQENRGCCFLDGGCYWDRTNDLFRVK